MADQTPNTPPPDEGFLHSLATSFGLDPEAVKETAKAIYAHPLETAKAVGSETASEVEDAVKNPVQTATDIGRGIAAQITNPDAQATAKKRLAQPGVGNKIAGAIEYAESGIPLVGGNLAKGEEQAAQGNVAGSLGTTVGTIAPMVTDTEPVQAAKTAIKNRAVDIAENIKEGVKAGADMALNAKAPEGSLEAGFAKIGGRKVKDPTPAPQGGHAGNGVASEEELARPGRFIKVGRGGAITDQTKTPDFNLRAGEAGYQVKPDGTVELKAGTETPTTKRAIENHAKTLYPTVDPRYEQTLARRGQLPNQTVNMDPAYGETGRYVAGLLQPTTPGGLKEHSTGDETIDQHIKKAGAIPAGTTVGDQVMFHDPITGSTLTLPRDQATSPEAVRKEITDSRARYGKNPAPAPHEAEPALNRITEKYGTSTDASKTRNGASFILPEGKFVHLGVDDHPQVISQSGYQFTGGRPVGEYIPAQEQHGDIRVPFINESGAIRSNFTTGRQGPILSFSVPAGGVKPEQIAAMREAVGQGLGRNGQLRIETAERPTQLKNSIKDFAKPSDVEPMLREIGAHPDQKAAPTAEEFIANAPEGVIKQDDPKAASVKKLVEENGGVFRGMQVNQVGDKRIGQVYIDVPPDRVGGKTNVTAGVALKDATPEGIKAAVDKMAAQHQPSMMGSLAEALSNPDSNYQIAKTRPERVAEIQSRMDANRRAGKNIWEGLTEDEKNIIGFDNQNRMQAVRTAVAKGGADFAGGPLADGRWNIQDPKTGQYVTVDGDVTPAKVKKALASVEPGMQMQMPDGSWRTIPKEAPEVSPNKTLQGSAQKYVKKQGMEPISHEPLKVDAKRAVAIANQYDQSEHAPNDPRVKAGYDALKAETLAQFHHLRDDLGLKFEPQEQDPYSSAGEMMDDIRKNNRLKVFSGSSTGPDHPLSEVAPGTGGHTYNTVFRWVYDAMGHAAGGNDFSEAGERSATEAHAQMYSDAARPAMRNETEGQTSWFFHNPAVEAGEKQPGAFAEQKANLIHDDWARQAGSDASSGMPGALDPKTGKVDTAGFGVEVYPEAKVRLDHAPTAGDFQDFYQKNKAIFDKQPGLRVGWYEDPDHGWEINIGTATSNREGAEWVARKLDQKSIYDIEGGREIQTGGTNTKTSFGRYDLDQRMADLSGKSFKDLQKDYPSQAAMRSMIRAGQVAKPWWQDSREAMHLMTNADPEAAHDLGQILTAVSSNKGNQIALRMALQIYLDWDAAGKPTEPGAISRIAEEAQAHLAESDEGLNLFGPVEPGKAQRMLPIDKGMLERYVAGQSFYHPEDLRAAKIANMGLTMGGDPWAGVLDRHTGRTLAFGKEMQPKSQAYFAMKNWLSQAAKAENMTLEEAQAANWVVGRLLSPDLSLTAPEILDKIKSGDTLKAGETYADLILNDPKVRGLAEKVITKFGGTPEKVFEDIKAITERGRDELLAGSKKEASNPTLKSYLGRAVRERDQAKLDTKK